MIPSWRLIFAAGTLVPFALAIDLTYKPFGWVLWLALLVLLIIAFIDKRSLLNRPLPQVTRQLSLQSSIAHWSDIHLTINADSKFYHRIRVYDHIPEGMQSQFLDQSIDIEKNFSTQITYHLRPLQRGHYHFEYCELRWPSRLGLWHQKYLAPCRSELRVYPDFTRLFNGKLTLDSWLNQLGVRNQPRRGTGSDFHQLREFREGDTLRMIDWNATARKQQPITKELQEERDQQVIFLLDCGRTMRSKDGDLSHFDHALNACLLLSYVALRQGDAVGLQTFAGEPRRIIPKKGSSQLTALLNALYDVETSLQTADYDAALESLLHHQQRRCLVIVLTNMRSIDQQLLSNTLKRVQRRHRVLFVNLREEVLDKACMEPVTSLDQANLYAGAIEFLNNRSEIQQTIEQQGVHLLDVRPTQLGPELISQYLAMKKAGFN